MLIAVAVALGTAAAWTLVDALYPLPQQLGAASHSPFITCFVSFVACAGFVIVFNIHGHGAVLCALGGAIAWAAYCVAEALGCDNLLCCFIATSAAAVFSEAMARVRKYPVISYLVISLLPLIPGTEVDILTGAIDGHCFLFADGVLIQELIDSNPIRGGHVGFSPYSTALKIRNIQVRKICWKKREQIYEPEF